MAACQICATRPADCVIVGNDRTKLRVCQSCGFATIAATVRL